MKKIFALLLLVSCVMNAQEKQFKYSLSGIEKVQIETNTATKVVVGTSSEIIIKESNHNNDFEYDHYDNDDKKIDKKKGLTAIYAGGKDDTNGFGFSVVKEGNLLIIRDLKSQFQRSSIEITLPKNMNINIDSGNLGSIDIEGFTGEVEAESNVGAINMKNVTGPITAHTSVGPITVDFTTVSQKSPITISSSVSEIDVTLPGNTKANLELKTGGTVYTNFDFPAPPKKGLPNVSGNKSINGTINNGGVKIQIKSSMGNIYLRKK